MRIITVNGRIAADVSRQVSKQGTEFINFSIANNEYGDPKSSTGTPQTQWFRVTSFLPQHVNLAQHLKKGKPVTVVGKYSNRLYQNQNTGQWGISNDVIASEICFEIGSERTTNASSNGTVSETTTAKVVKEAVDEIPQVTSSKTSQANKSTVSASATADVAFDTMDDDDGLPF